MSSNNKEPSTSFKRKSPSTQKKPSRTQRQSQKEPRQRCTRRTHLPPRKAVPPYALKDDKEGGGSPGLDDLIFHSRGDCLESRASPPVSSVGENEWVNLSGVSHSSTRIQSAASDWNTGEPPTTSPSTPTSYKEQNKEVAFKYDKENLEEEISPQTKEEVSPAHYSLRSNTSTFGSGYFDKKGLSQSFHKTRTGSYEELTQIAFEEHTGKAGQTEMKSLWKLHRSLILSSEFPISLVEPNKPELKCTPKRAPDLLHDTSLPPLAKDKSNKDGVQRSGSLPSASSLNTSGLQFSATWNQASQSSGSCQIRLPESFPGVRITPPPPEEPQTESVSDEELGSLIQKRADTPSAPLKKTKENEGRSRVDRLRVPCASAQPPTSTRSSPGPQNYNTNDEPMAIRWASSEFLAARVVSELDSAFTQTFSQDGKPNRIEGCVTPNSMARSNSLATPRLNTFCSDETTSVAFSAVHRGYSNSMPNLPTSAKPTRRVFVTFDNDFPRATAVNLQGKSEIAARCRNLNRKMDKLVKKSEKTNPGIELAQTNPVQKTVMIRNWVESCSPRGVKKRATNFPVYTK